jgi:ABC-type phosphate/phosphonate transport system substrate-binding protein
MYDFAEVQSSTGALREAIVREVCELGDEVVVGTPENTEHESLLTFWLGTEMYMSQSCGLPFIEELKDSVDILGTFLWTGISDDYGNYRSHILVRDDFGASEVSELRDARPVINSTQSLSGWCSLGCALAEVTDDPGFVQPYFASRYHARSLKLMQEGAADVTSIDAATYQLLRRHRPSLVYGLRVIGSGPLIPATPIIVSKTRAASMNDLRAMLQDIVAADSLAAAMSEIGIVGVVNRDRRDYEVVHDLVASAERVLPRHE